MSDPEFSLHVDGGIVVVRWLPGVEITGPLATEEPVEVALAMPALAGFQVR